jgi:hypothetical protein
LKKVFTRLAAAAVMAVASLSAHAAFDITINYTGDAQYRSYFTDAENFWESAITGYQSGINLTGFTINASIGAIDGQWHVLGYSGPTSAISQGGYVLTTAGNMVFDQADMTYMTSSGSFGDVIRHEMGHVIGIGTLWGYNTGYVDGSGQYTGAAGLAMYRTEFNQPGATYIPVELGGGGGTADGHWNEVDNGAGPTGIVDSQGRDMQYELMTGWLNGPTFTSKTTVASLQDIGYTVNLNAVAAVPEPESVLLFAVGVPVLARFARRRKLTAA